MNDEQSSDQVGTGPTNVRIRVIGQIDVVVDDKRVTLQRGQQQIIALLVAAGPEGTSSDRLADEIWNEDLPGRWKNSLRVAVSRVRGKTGLKIPFSEQRYRLDASVEQVDAWRLLAVTENTVVPDTDFESLLASNDLFPGVEPSLWIEQAGGQIGAAQRSLIERLAEEQKPQTRRSLEALITHLDYDRTDESLTHAVAKIHVTNGLQAISLGLIERCTSARHGLQPTADSERLEELARSIRSEDGGLEPKTPTAPPAQLPPILERYSPAHFVGRTAELESLEATLSGPSPSIAVVQGQPGSGKTSLLAELGRIAIRRHQAHVAYVTSAESGTVGLAPLRMGIAGFAEQIALIDERKLDPAGRMGLLADRLVEMLREAASGRHVVLLVDDAHWVDTPTAELLNYLARSSADLTGLTLVIAARAQSTTRAPWAELQRELDRLPGRADVTLGPLAIDELAVLVGRGRPEMTFAGRDQLTNWLHQASSGLPAVAIRMLDSAMASGPEEETVDGVFDRLIGSIDDQVVEVAVAAAVMGREFRLSDLMALLDKSEEGLFDAIDELLGTDLINETGSLDRFEFSHQLIAEAFLRAQSRARRARLHVKASGLTNDVHALSRHMVEAGDLVKPQDRLSAVLRSARTHLFDREYWESAGQFRVAVGLDDGSLSPSVFVDFAAALSLSGARGPSFTMRKKAFDNAVASRDWDAAVDAACSGLPGAETPDGEEDRLAYLELIPADELSEQKRLTQAVTAARLSAQLGRPDQARTWAAHATALAATDQERAEAALGERFMQVIDVPPDRRLAILDAAMHGLNVPLRESCRAEQYRAVDQLESGRLGIAEKELRSFSLSANEIRDPLRQWHSQVFEALLCEVQGRWTESDALAEQALGFGRRFGIAQADIVRLAQGYFRLEAQGLLSLLSEAIDAVPVDDAASLLFAAAKTKVLLVSGQREDAIELAGQLAEQILARPSVTSQGCLALMAPVLGLHSSTELRAGARAALEPFRGQAMIIGVGLGLLGSVDLLLAHLTDGGVQEADLQQAVDFADRCGFTSWAVRYRLDLAAMTATNGPWRQPAVLPQART